MERVVNECAAHLVNDLSSDTCIETRSLPGINRNKNFVSKVDQYIADHVSFLCDFLDNFADDFLVAVPRAFGDIQLPSASIHPDRSPPPDKARDGNGR